MAAVTDQAQRAANQLELQHSSAIPCHATRGRCAASSRRRLQVGRFRRNYLFPRHRSTNPAVSMARSTATGMWNRMPCDFGYFCRTEPLPPPMSTPDFVVQAAPEDRHRPQRLGQVAAEAFRHVLFAGPNGRGSRPFLWRQKQVLSKTIPLALLKNGKLFVPALAVVYYILNVHSTRLCNRVFPSGELASIVHGQLQACEIWSKAEWLIVFGYRIDWFPDDVLSQ